MSDPTDPIVAPPRLRLPRLAHALLGLYVGCLFADALSGGVLSGVSLLVPGFLWEGDWHRLLLAPLFHGDPIDLLVDAALLLAAVPAAERLFGIGRTVLTLAVSGVAAGALSAAVLPTDFVACASGAVFGVVGLLVGVIAFRRGLLPQVVESRMLLVLGIGVLAETLVGLFLPLVNNVMHAGGLISGLLLSAVLEPAVPVERRPWAALPAAALLPALLAIALLASGARTHATLARELVRAEEAHTSGNVDAAIARLERALGREARGGDRRLLPLAQNALAWFYVETKRDLDRAFRLSKESNEAMDGNPAFLDTLGYLYALKGDCRGAADQMGRAADIDKSYSRRRDEVNQACSAGRPPDTAIPVETPKPPLPITGRGIRV